MGYPGSGRPGEIQDVLTFMQGLRELKKCSRLSYRQLEERAMAAGDVLPRSSTSSMLSRDIPPRPDLLAAFVRACGEEDRVAEWIEARDRVAGALDKEPVTPPVVPGVSGSEPGSWGNPGLRLRHRHG